MTTSTHIATVSEPEQLPSGTWLAAASCSCNWRGTAEGLSPYKAREHVKARHTAHITAAQRPGPRSNARASAPPSGRSSSRAADPGGAGRGHEGTRPRKVAKAPQPSQHTLYIHKEVQFPVRYLEARCTGPICRWRHRAYDKEEAQARIILSDAWDAHLAKIREQAEAMEAFNRKNEESGGALAIKLNIVMGAIAAVIVGLLLWGVWSLVSGGLSDSSDSPWDTCSGYREDVEPGSAQDGRDVENGNNPC